MEAAKPSEVENAGEAGHAEVSSPTEHIEDHVLLGLDARTGKLTSKTYDEHGQPIAGYVPKSLFRAGPLEFKLEFTKHMLAVAITAALFFTLAMLVARKVKASLAGNRAPSGPLANLVEAIVVYVRDEIVVPVGGHHLGHYTPLFLTYFVFILLANLLGMIPYPALGTATGNISVTLGLGGSIYALIWIMGISHQGFLHFIGNLVPPGTPWWMWPLLFVLEIMGPIIKCGVLCVRLFANMIAGHLIISTILGLTTFGVGSMVPWGIALMMLVCGLPLALGISILELLVALIQAYVFTLLAVVFIGAAVHPEH
jgi:F-type H+-transporting ATPase subunit a